ncbi:hypothetical protein BV25DRAFT_1919250 [Artomyces pyxidatus]|uniref:Uncharacterized protein n=1 Tax=Artomyces pyxidatus TaxID=48021 RepID=A0ACB8SPP5_9AGAM|nr:hypothetical protein BV25DRAFT_1919250 [Artomyces pyxidatus]
MSSESVFRYSSSASDEDSSLTVEDMLEEQRHRVALHEEYKRKAREARKPVAQLPTKYNPRLTAGPPQVHFGLVLTQQHLLDYANAHALAHTSGKPLTTISCRLPVTLHLRSLTNDDNLYTATPYVQDGPGFIMVALYSNYSMHRHKLVEEDENEVLDILRRALKLESQPALWHWDAGNTW